MHPKKFNKIMKFSAEDRYSYFIRKIADSEVVWGLYNNGWATAENNNGDISIPFWPESEFAKACCANSWSEYEPEKIDLKIFLDKWLRGMESDNLLLAVFPTPNNKGIFIDPIETLMHLQEELSQYED